MMTKDSLIASLPRLQREQQLHDITAHQDILSRSVSDRLKHFTLHFAKYQGQLIVAHESGDRERAAELLTDSMIIALATANTLNIHLRDRTTPAFHNELVLSRSPSDYAARADTLWLGYVKTVGRMAKACEAYDHFEDFPSRQVLEDSVISLIPTIYCLAELIAADLLIRVPKRWAAIESRLAMTEGGTQKSSRSAYTEVA